MPAERFFLPAEFSIGTRVCLSGHEHHHLSRVMRLAVGDEAELVNGTGGLATGRIAEVERELTTLEIKAASKTAPSLEARVGRRKGDGTRRRRLSPLQCRSF